MINQEQYPDNKSNHESQFKCLENLYDLSHEMLTLLLLGARPWGNSPIASTMFLRSGYEAMRHSLWMSTSGGYPLSSIVVLTLHISCSLEPSLTWFTTWTVLNFMVRNTATGVQSLHREVIVSSSRDPCLDVLLLQKLSPRYSGPWTARTSSLSRETQARERSDLPTDFVNSTSLSCNNPITSILSKSHPKQRQNPHL